MSFFSKLGNFRKSFVKHWKRNTLVIVLLIIAFLIYKSATAEPAGVETTKVNKTTLVTDFTANGQIKAKKEADLKFFTPGKIAWVGVADGDRVNAGQVVARQDTIALAASYQVSLNNLRNFQAIAESVLDSVQGHEEDETFAMRATRTTAEVNRDNAYEQTLVAQDSIDNAILKSPFAGTVVGVSDLKSGVNLTGADLGNNYVRVVDLNSLYFRAQVDEVDYSKVKLGQDVEITVDAYPGESCNGKVSYISRDGEETSGGVVTIPTDVTFENCNLAYAVNLNGQANFVTSKLDNVLVIPKKYIVTKDGVDYVWKQTGSSTKNRMLAPITVGASNATEVEVTAGLIEGDTIVFIP